MRIGTYNNYKAMISFKDFLSHNKFFKYGKWNNKKCKLF